MSGEWSEADAGTTAYYLDDGLGSTMQLTDASGTVTDSYTYDAFGAMTQHTGTNPQPFGYAGQQQDVGAEGGLVYLRARYYDPALGRFLTQDPVSFLQRYAYAGNDPENLIDPSGLCWVCDVGTAIGHGAENVGNGIVDNVTDPKSLAGDIQLASGVIVAGCLYASPTAEGGGVGLPVCAAAAPAYGASVAYQAYYAKDTHERIVILASAGVGVLPVGKAGEIATDALAPLAEPRSRGGAW